MIHRQLPGRNRVRRGRSRAETIDLLKDAFVCVTIPIATFGIAYLTLTTFAQVFLG